MATLEKDVLLLSKQEKDLIIEYPATRMQNIIDLPNTFPPSSHTHDDIYERKFEKNTAFNKDFGDTENTVCQGNDERLYNARKPTTHKHSKSEITDFPTKVSAFDNDKNYQNEEQVKRLLSSLVNSAPETLDTLAELANALGNDPNFATTVTTMIGTKAPLNHQHSKSEITDFPTKLSQFTNDQKYQTDGQVKETVNTVNQKLKDQCNQNRIELTNSSYYPTTVGYRSGQVVYLKCAGTLAKEVPANAGYVVALSMPAEYCPNVDITAHPNISYAGKNIKIDISTTGKVTLTTPEKLPVGFGINMHFTYMTGKSNF